MHVRYKQRSTGLATCVPAPPVGGSGTVVPLICQSAVVHSLHAIICAVSVEYLRFHGLPTLTDAQRSANQTLRVRNTTSISALCEGCQSYLSRVGSCKENQIR